MAKRKKSKRLLSQRQRTGLMILSTVIALASLLASLAVLFNFDPQTLSISAGTVQYTNASTVYIGETNYNLLSSRYKADKDEFIYCLYGENHEDGYIVTELRETEYTADEDSVSYQPCSRLGGGYLGTIHSHPDPNDPRYRASCGMSKQDIYTFGGDGSALSAIICGEHEFAFYESDDLEIAIEHIVLEDDNNGK